MTSKNGETSASERKEGELRSSDADMRAAVDRIMIGRVRVPPDKELAYIRSEVQKLPKADRDVIENLVLATERAVEYKLKNKLQDWEKVTAATSIIALVGILVLAFVFTQPTATQAGTMRVIMALAAGALAIVIPGVLEVHAEVPVAKATIRGTAGFALFVITYFWNPAGF